MKVLCVFGTRPEAIKMAPVIQELRKHPEEFQVKVCITAQHRLMLDQVLQLFQIRPDYDLNIMEENQSLSELTSNIIAALQTVMNQEKPDWVLVQGDTTSSMAAALVAFYNRLKVGHIEAGLRTANKFYPFPEETNRKITSTLCDLHFAPTTEARGNLLKEGIDPCKIAITGNTVIDALHQIAALPVDNRILSRISIANDHTRLLLVTAHRRENFGQPLKNICDALLRIASAYPEVRIVYPVHLNPNVQHIVYKVLGDIRNVKLTEPLNYVSMIHLIMRSYLVLTDSGGIQEEAPAFGKPVLLLRELTERPEAIKAGTVRVVGTSTEVIVRETCRLLDDPNEYQRMARAVNPYGDGHAAERTVAALLNA